MPDSAPAAAAATKVRILGFAERLVAAMTSGRLIEPTGSSEGHPSIHILGDASEGLKHLHTVAAGIAMEHNQIVEEVNKQIASDRGSRRRLTLTPEQLVLVETAEALKELHNVVDSLVTLQIKAEFPDHRHKHHLFLAKDWKVVWVDCGCEEQSEEDLAIRFVVGMGADPFEGRGRDPLMDLLLRGLRSTGAPFGFRLRR